MSKRTIFIKNMVCDRCILAIKYVLENQDLTALSVNMGSVEFMHDLSDEQKENFSKAVERLGFELIEDRKGRIIENIKQIIIDLVTGMDALSELKLSSFFSKALHYDYNYLSSLFSAVEGITLEQYLIQQKVEKAKELMIYDELNMSEISDKLGYSSLAHFSGQFKKITGLTPSNFKRQRDTRQRKSLDKL